MARQIGDRLDTRLPVPGTSTLDAELDDGVEVKDAIEVLVQLRNGERRSIVQAKGNETLGAGDAVILVTTGGKTRVTRAPGSTPAVPAEPKG